MRDKVEFKVDKDTYTILQPTQQQISDADLVYKSKYSEGVRAGMLTHAEAGRFIQDRKIWTEEDSQKASEILLEITKLGSALEKVTDVAEGLEMVGEVEEKRIELLRLNSRKNEILDNTAESYADEKRLNFYVIKCTYDAAGQPVFKNMSTLVELGNSEVAVEATRNTIQLLANDGEDFRINWPDYQWRVKNGLLDEELNPVEGALDKIIEEMQTREAVVKPTAKKKAKKNTKRKTAKK